MVQSVSMSISDSNFISPDRSLDSMNETQPHVKPARRRRSCCSIVMVILGVFLCLGLAGVLLIPSHTNILLLGIDRTPQGSVAGRSDTMILMSVQPADAQINMLSIPRDLWVAIPGVGENRINAAHLFAENEQPGTGPAAALETVHLNFGVDVDYYVRIQFEGIQVFVDALGGIPLELDSTMGKFPPGEYLLDGETALAFVRDRSGGDDFFRMEHAQVFLRAVMEHMLDPRVWVNLPEAIFSSQKYIDSNIPIWQIPPLLITFARTGIEGIDMRSIDRTMVQGTTTPEGAQVLLPNWTAIHTLLLELFDQ
jgi:LCP family protein required for cell wall assembly